MKKSFWELFFLFAYLFVGVWFSFVFEVNLLVSLFVLYLSPVLYFSYVDKKRIKDFLIFSILFGLVFGIIVDYIGHVTKIWEIHSAFSFKIFGFVSIELLVWSFLVVYKA